MRARNAAVAWMGVAVLAGAGLAPPASGLDEPVDRRITYQGQVEGRTGPAQIVFRIFDGSGAVVWGPETHQVDLDDQGRFVTLIGSTGLDLCNRVAGDLVCTGPDAGPDGIPDLDQIAAEGLELEVTVDGVTLSPRQRLVPAFQAAKASSVDDGAVARAGLASDVLRGLVPTGAVLPFAGPATSVPAGWLPCDGRQLEEGAYPDLFSVIGTTHGGGTGVFHVPDYQGRFLRGVANGSGRDPDPGGRSAMNPGGNAGNQVGSVQGDTFQGHWHASDRHDHEGTTALETNAPHRHDLRNRDTDVTLQLTNKNDGSTDSHFLLDEAGSGNPRHPLGTKGGAHVHNFTTLPSRSLPRSPTSDGANGTPRFGAETRPKNAYVNFIIRCGPADAC